MKILCSNITGNQYCGGMQDPVVEGWECKHCHKELSAENMIVYSDNESLRYFIGFSEDKSESKVVLADTWDQAEDKLLPLTIVYLASYNESLASIK